MHIYAVIRVTFKIGGAYNICTCTKIIGYFSLHVYGNGAVLANGQDVLSNLRQTP